jgi:hypothetical protein
MPVQDRRYVKTDAENFIRDRKNAAVLNTDLDSLAAYKKERDRILRADSIVEDVNSLKKEFSEIKDLLIQLVNKQ